MGYRPDGAMRWSNAASGALGRMMSFFMYEDGEILGPEIVYWAERMARRRRAAAVGFVDVTAALKCIAYADRAETTITERIAR